MGIHRERESSRLMGTALFDMMQYRYRHLLPFHDTIQYG